MEHKEIDQKVFVEQKETEQKVIQKRKRLDINKEALYIPKSLHSIKNMTTKKTLTKRLEESQAKAQKLL